jgi:putative ABC transport system permease protein
VVIMRPLTRKLWRDAWHTRGQLGAIALVVASGMALFVSLRSMHDYLRNGRDNYYRDTRFGDAFAFVKRAPRGILPDVSALRGIREVEARLVFDVTLDVPGLEEPATGRLVSVPVPRAPMLNALTLTRGQWPHPGYHDEVIVSQAFARANQLVPGDSIGAILNGTWRTLRIVGTAISPEYVYEIGSASFFPDNRRFGVIWMGTDAVAAAFDMRGAFNAVTFMLTPQVSLPTTLSAVDTLLAPFGGPGAFPRRDQMSDQFLSGEIEETQVTSILLPGIFLGVTAFLLHIVLSRLVGTQREQVAMLKAFGYRDGTIAMHFLALALVPIGAGALIGAVLGSALAGALADIYARFFQFPFTAYRQDPEVVALGLAITVGAGLAGAMRAVRRTVALPPAEAMRPEAPARYRRGFLEEAGLRVGPAAQVVVRQLERRPARAALSVLGLGVAGGLVTMSLGMFDTVQYMKALQFYRVERASTTVAFAQPAPPRALTSLARLDGVLEVEPFRALPVRLTGPGGHYRTSLLALAPDARLRTLSDVDGHLHRVPPVGILLGEALADTLGATGGGLLEVEVLEGARRRLKLPVAGIFSDLIGMSAYIDLSLVPALTGEERTYSGAWLHLDARRAADTYAALSRLPVVAGTSSRAAALEGFERTIAESFRISLLTTLVFSCVIAFGIVYNSGRITLSERGRELASLRVLGFTRREVGAMLIGEQAVLVLVSIPVAMAVAAFLAWLVAIRFESTLFRLPVVIAPWSQVLGALVVMLAAAGSALLILRRLARLDLVAVLKSRE